MRMVRLVLVVIGLQVVVVVISLSGTAIGFGVLVMMVGKGRATRLTIDSLLPLTLAAESGNVTLDATVKTGRCPHVWMTLELLVSCGCHCYR